MLKKFLLSGATLLLATGYCAFAQQTFTITTADTVTAAHLVGGVLQMESSLENTSPDNQTFSYKWKLIHKDIPADWAISSFIVGFCDNLSCRPSDQWIDGQTNSSLPVAPDNNPDVDAFLHLQLNQPGTTGTAIFTFEIFTDDESDTLTYVYSNGNTGVSIINQNDARVKLFPNPAASHINVYAAQSLHPETISILDLTGRQVATTGVQAGSETTNVDISTLAAGMYMVRVTDMDNKVITSRKFTKQ